MTKKTAAAAAFAAAMIFTTTNVSATATEVSLSHESGFYDGTQYVTVINSGSNDIYYTTDGTMPNTDSELFIGESIIVSKNSVVRIAEYSGDELISSDKSTIKIRTTVPKASVTSGNYTEAFKVKLTCAAPNAEIYYTTDGTIPTQESKKYTKAITISKTTTLKFAAYAPDKSRSRVVTAKYVIQEDQFENKLCQQLFELVNETRAEYGLKPLKASTKLTEAAEIRAKEYSYYQSHYRPDGTKWDSILTAYGLRRNVRAENLAYYYTSAKAAMKCWMSDPYHRANILNPDTEYIGLACYNNGWCNYWCQLFIGGE